MSEAQIAGSGGSDPLTIDRLRSLLKYDPATGHFEWLVRKSANAKIGDIAGAIDPSGYRLIRIDMNLYRACRLAWFYMHAAWPPIQIDHINLVRSDDRIENLRLASNGQNSMNKRVRRDNKSRLKGAMWSSRRRKWFSRITLEGETKYLGSFDTAIEAHVAYIRASEKLHRNFARAA